ncbi:MAG: hypothetical protein ACE5K0_02340 [Candidatus Methanofastidiosia archaeon]
MKKKVKILKKFGISMVIIRPENIRELAKKVYKEYTNDSKKKNRHISIDFFLKEHDGTQYESENIEIFSEGGILETRRIIEIEMRYHNYSEDKRISVDLEHSIRENRWGNKVVVSGYDDIWTNGVLKSIESIISSWENQVNWPYRYKDLLIILFGIGITLLYINILDIINSYIFVIQPLSPQPQWAKDIIPTLKIGAYFLVFLGAMIWPALYIVNKICELYPPVEFTTGPEYSYVEKIRRKKLYTFLSVGIIPLIISLIYELIKIYFGKT